jgi:hypothetical protein
MSQADYDQAPDSLMVRELHAGGKLLVTTLLCSKTTTKAALKKLYRGRSGLLGYRTQQTVMMRSNLPNCSC